MPRNISFVPVRQMKRSEYWLKHSQKNLQQAGIHAGTLAGGATSAFSETALLLILKTVGGIGGGLMLGANEVAHEVS